MEPRTALAPLMVIHDEEKMRVVAQFEITEQNSCGFQIEPLPKCALCRCFLFRVDSQQQLE
jgi:hypothetical protein